MSAIARGFCKYFQPNGRISAILSDRNSILLQFARPYSFENILTKHNDKDYEYEISRDPEEWKYVERLIPPRLVPKIQKKDVYPSGWRPQTADAKNLPYFVERSKNQMLPVYFHCANRSQKRYTTLKHIRGDIWKLFDELKAHLEKETNRPMAMCVHEGNCFIQIKGDYVYYVEQWLLSKGL